MKKGTRNHFITAAVILVLLCTAVYVTYAVTSPIGIVSRLFGRSDDLNWGTAAGAVGRIAVDVSDKVEDNRRVQLILQNTELEKQLASARAQADRERTLREAQDRAIQRFQEETDRLKSDRATLREHLGNIVAVERADCPPGEVFPKSALVYDTLKQEWRNRDAQ